MSIETTHSKSDDELSLKEVSEQEKQLKAASERFLYITTFFAAIGGFLFGYDTGVISGALLYLQEEFNLDDLDQSLIVSVALGGAIFGALFAGWLGDYFGRRITVSVASILFIIGSIILGASINIPMLIFGRFVVGAGIGVASNIVPVFVAEISPPDKRGSLVALNNLFITGGQLISYLVDSAFAEVPNGWRYMLGLAAVPALVQLIGMIFLIPESPRWLVGKGRIDEALSITQKIRGTTEVTKEMDEIEQSVRDDSQQDWRAIFDRNMLKTLGLGMSLQIIQQFLGINTAMYYSATIIKMSGVRDNQTAIWFSDLVAATNMIFTIYSIYLIDRIGRRALLLSTMIPTIVCLVLLGFAFYARDNFIMPFSVTGVFALDALVLYVAFFAIGLGPIPWAVNSEIYPLKVRAVGNSIATTMNWVANLIISMSFLSFVNVVTQAGAFWTYAGFGVLAWVYLYYQLPETMGKTMEQIQSELGNTKKTSHAIQ
eukprot:TRINITY_DN9745_c0_g1_i1.p1 TRINITY_DN9745_c0_g1~~TRINITY_DN9745_c0_g1_i1.p1  ORF type:complete len:487 (-),score=87.85 TRINITY_DN9745_c0_g1_i1:47-1507(-)